MLPVFVVLVLLTHDTCIKWVPFIVSSLSLKVTPSLEFTLQGNYPKGPLLSQLGPLLNSLILFCISFHVALPSVGPSTQLWTLGLQPGRRLIQRDPTSGYYQNGNPTVDYLRHDDLSLDNAHPSTNFPLVDLERTEDVPIIHFSKSYSSYFISIIHDFVLQRQLIFILLEDCFKQF